MAKFREPFYIDRKHAVMQALSSIIALAYVVSLLISIYMSSFGGPLITMGDTEEEIAFQTPRDVVVSSYEEMDDMVFKQGNVWK